MSLRTLVIGLAVAMVTCSGSFRAAAVGPDVIVGELAECQQFGRVGPVGAGTVGLGIGTSGCNKGDVPLHWFAFPSTDHPMFPVNMYRLKMAEGASRFEQIGQSWVKHGTGAAQFDVCQLGCTPHPDFTQLGVGCSDPYAAGQIADPCQFVGPRSAVNPYTGEIPGGGSLGAGGGCDDEFFTNYPAVNHIGHVHDGISHRLQIREADLLRSGNPGARYFGEAQYIAPHEFTAGNGNQNNNVSHREYRVSGPYADGLYLFAPAGDTASESPAADAWPGASQTLIEPAPLADGRAVLVYEATDLGDGLWHYEYALYNMNLDRSLRSITIPIAAGVTVSGVGFHAPLNHAAEANADNYSNDPWQVSQDGASITWSTDLFPVDPLANAVRWATMYNFRFDANAPPQSVVASVGLYKTGGTTSAATVAPSALGFQDCNDNSIDDRCDLDCAAPGCGVPGCGQSADCTENGIPDECEADCNSNGTADRCELAAGTVEDCNSNGVPDVCDAGGALDCNGNQAADFCDILLDTSADFNNNGVPDECDPHLGTIYVDDDGPGDPGPGDPAVGDPDEDGSVAHPFDAIQEAIDVSLSGDIVVVADGTYTGAGNRNVSYGGRPITVRSENGPEGCVVDLEFAARGFDFESGESNAARLEGFTIINAIGDPTFLLNPAIYCVNGSPTILDCVLSGNTTAAIEVWNVSRPIIDRCRLVNNGVGGIYCVDSSPTIRNSLFAGNGFAGIVVWNGVGPEIINCTVVNNPFGVFASNAVPTLRNCIVRLNASEQVTPGADVAYSNVEGGAPGDGNVDADPLFADQAGGDYRLLAGSPSIDAADNTAMCAGIDLDGNPRFLDDPDTADTGIAGPPGLPVTDMGAYEFVPADCNDNATPDAAEILLDPGLDADGNAILDECEPPLPDCNANGLIDVCEPDCNGNGIADACDIVSEFSSDLNGNGVPDECDVPLNDACEDAIVVCQNLTPDPDVGLCDNAHVGNPDNIPLGTHCSVSAQDCYDSSICGPWQTEGGLPLDAYRCFVQTDNSNATTDGPVEAGNCLPTNFEADVWYRITAPCTGEMIISMCNAVLQYDSMIGVFGDHSPPPACPGSSNDTLLVCDDDYCPGSGTVSGGQVSVVAGAEYIVRVGGWSPDGTAEQAAQGVSELDIGFLCDPVPPDAPEVPPDAVHQAAKHRYLSVNPSATGSDPFGLEVTLSAMRRCVNDLERACNPDRCSAESVNAGVPCTTDNNCINGTCISECGTFGLCQQHPDVGSVWWVQAPQEEPLGCLPGPCGPTDRFARVEPRPGDVPLTEDFRFWDLELLHVGDCEIVPAATYEIRACLPPDGTICGDPLTIGTVNQPFIAPGFRGNFGDVAGPVVGTEFTPPDGIGNIGDVSAYVLTSQNYGTANTPQAHPTWVDLHGLVLRCSGSGDNCLSNDDCPQGETCAAAPGNPPQYILNVADLGQILKALQGNKWTDDPGNLNPASCP